MGTKGSGEFFAVDRRTWATVCALGMNPAVAYLVLAAFSGRNNSTTAASTNAIEKYTGIARSRAREAIGKLVEKGLVKQTQGGSRPRYELVLFADLPRPPPPPDTRQPLTALEREVFACIGRGEQPHGRQRTNAHNMVVKRWLHRDHATDTFRAVTPPVPPPIDPEPERIWLPNTLVTGAKSETPPVERVRQTADVMCLRLLVDLYYGQDLRADGGISRKHVYSKYVRKKLYARGEYTVWAFWPESSPTKWVAWSELMLCHQREPTAEEKKNDPKASRGDDFFRRLGLLEVAGLVEWFAYLCESESPDAELIHPLGGIGRATGPENDVALEAYKAGYALLDAASLKWADEYNHHGVLLVPVRHHFANVAVVGVARLRYRPRTSNTAAWWGELNDSIRRCIAGYQDIAQGKASAVIATG